MAKDADMIGGGDVVVVNPESDTSIEALQDWIARLEDEADWIELPASAADLIDEDRRASGS